MRRLVTVFLVLSALVVWLLSKGSPPAEATQSVNIVIDAPNDPSIASDPPPQYYLEQTPPPPSPRLVVDAPAFRSLRDQDPATVNARKCETFAAVVRSAPSVEDAIVQLEAVAPYQGHSTDWAPTFGAAPSYAEMMRCVGIIGSRGKMMKPGIWEERIPPVLFHSHHAGMLVMHGAVSPGVLMRQALRLAELLRVDKYAVALRRAVTAPGIAADAVAALEKKLNDARGDPADVIVELGCGNGGLLFAMCPPIAAVRCFGVDFAPRAIEHAQFHMPYIDFRVDFAAPHVPAGAASAVLSHAVMTYLTGEQACRHVGEMLRLLRPGGRAVAWMLIQKPFGARIAPSFFFEDVPGESARRVLQFCPGLAKLCRDVEVILSDESFPLYTPRRDYFGAVITRNDQPFGSEPKAPLPDEAHRRFRLDVEPLITEPEGMNRYARGNVTALRQYIAMVNSTALHRFRRKDALRRPYWSAEGGGRGPARKQRSKRV